MPEIKKYLVKDIHGTVKRYRSKENYLSDIFYWIQNHSDDLQDLSFLKKYENDETFIRAYYRWLKKKRENTTSQISN